MQVKMTYLARTVKSNQIKFIKQKDHKATYSPIPFFVFSNKTWETIQIALLSPHLKFYAFQKFPSLDWSSTQNQSDTPKLYEYTVKPEIFARR